MSRRVPSPQPLIAAAPDLVDAVERWQRYLSAERRLARNSLVAYARDVSQFLSFLTGHIGQPPRVTDVANLATADFRAFMAARRTEGIEWRTSARAVSRTCHDVPVLR